MSDKKITRKEFLMLAGGLVLLFVASMPTKFLKDALAKSGGKAGYGTQSYGGKA